MAKRALVLGGGGSKGSYQMGAWKAFKELGIEFDMIVGTSIGSLNGAAMVQGDYDLASGLWDSIEYKNVFGEDRGEVDINTPIDFVKYALSDFLFEGSFDTDLLEELTSRYISEERVRNSPIEFGLMTVELPGMKPRGMMIDDIPEGKLIPFLMASSACFPVFKPKEIDGVKYVDGGYYDNVPINLALENGATEVIVVDLDAIGLVRHVKESLRDDAPVITVRPYWNLGGSFGFDKNTYSRNRILGYNDTMKALGHMEGMYYTFHLGECEKNAKRLTREVDRARVRIDQMLNRPVAKTLQSLDKRSTLAFLSNGDWDENKPEMICRLAETAGVVFDISPEKVYTFDEFNRALLKEYLKYGGVFFHAGEFTGNITGILSLVANAVDNRQITSQITQLMLGRMPDSESLWTLAELMPREFIAAVYITLLLENQGIMPNLE